MGYGLQTYISVKGTLHNCTKSNPLRNRADGVEAVDMVALCFLRTFTGHNNEKPTESTEFSRTFYLGYGLATYITVKGTLHTCTISSPQQNQTDGVEAVAVGAMCFLRTFPGRNNENWTARTEFSRTFYLDYGLKTYNSVKWTLHTCTKLNPQRNRTDGVKAVAEGAMCLLLLFKGRNNLATYISVQETLHTCIKSNLQRNRTNGVEAVAVCALCFFKVHLQDVTTKDGPHAQSSH
jgi:hypothetical protein